MTGLFVAANYAGTKGKRLSINTTKGKQAKMPEEKERYDYIPSAIAKAGIDKKTEQKALRLAANKYRYRINYAILIGFSILIYHFKEA